MLFNSVPFIFFFPLVTILFFVVPQPYRWFLLLMASCIFYTWFIPVYLVVLFVLILIDYWMGIWIEDSMLKGVDARKYLIVSIVSMCSILFFFKYFDFFGANLSSIAGFFGLNYPPKVLGLIIPIGLSFHTFQSLSYVIEVYKGRQKAERHFGIYALYVMFYPQLVAGPIERPYNLLPQFREKQSVDYQRISDGLKLMAWGMFKKVVIADRLAVLVDQVFRDVGSYHGPEFVVALFFFAFQLYCDFSGYCDIAVGSAKVMGFKLMDNFRYPYFSRSVRKFWRCWHISLFSWLRDYVFIPLCRHRYFKHFRRVNIFLMFLISGVWHGAGWTYVAWGALTGFYVVLDAATEDFRKNMRRIVGIKEENFFLKAWQVSATFLLFCFSAIFFRAETMQDSWFILRQLPAGWPQGSFNVSDFCYARFGLDVTWFSISINLVIVLVFIDLLQRGTSGRPVFSNDPVWVRWSYYYGLVLGMIFLGHYGQNQFVYFQF